MFRKPEKIVRKDIVVALHFADKMTWIKIPPDFCNKSFFKQNLTLVDHEHIAHFNMSNFEIEEFDGKADYHWVFRVNMPKEFSSECSPPRVAFFKYNTDCNTDEGFKYLSPALGILNKENSPGNVPERFLSCHYRGTLENYCCRYFEDSDAHKICLLAVHTNSGTHYVVDDFDVEFSGVINDAKMNRIIEEGSFLCGDVTNRTDVFKVTHLLYDGPHNGRVEPNSSCPMPRHNEGFQYVRVNLLDRDDYLELHFDTEDNAKGLEDLFKTFPVSYIKRILSCRDVPKEDNEVTNALDIYDFVSIDGWFDSEDYDPWRLAFDNYEETVLIPKGQSLYKLSLYLPDSFSDPRKWDSVEVMAYSIFFSRSLKRTDNVDSDVYPDPACLTSLISLNLRFEGLNYGLLSFRIRQNGLNSFFEDVSYHELQELLVEKVGSDSETREIIRRMDTQQNQVAYLKQKLLKPSKSIEPKPTKPNFGRVLPNGLKNKV